LIPNYEKKIILWGVMKKCKNHTKCKYQHGK
jgi:hypothetical protein